MREAVREPVRDSERARERPRERAREAVREPVRAGEAVREPERARGIEIVAFSLRFMSFSSLWDRKHTYYNINIEFMLVI